MGSKRLTREIKQSILSMYASDCSTREIARQLKISRRSAWRIVANAGINRTVSEAKKGKGFGHLNPNYKRGYRMNRGYKIVRLPVGTRTDKERAEHDLIAEQVLGRSLKENELCHHVDGNKAENVNHNLVICDRGLHQVLERRTRALRACGHANWRKCVFCKNYDTPENLINNRYHKECCRVYMKCHRPNKKPAKKTATAANP